MKFIYKLGLSLGVILYSSISLAAHCDSTCQLKQIQYYFSALDKISRKGSSIKDIDSPFALTHDDVKYIHVEYEANFDKESWRKAFIRNVERGAYQKGAENQIQVINTIFGKKHTAIEYSHGVIQQDGTWVKTKPLFVLFGFSDGKISLIKEYW